MYSNKKREADQYIKNNKHKINDQYRLNYHLMGEYGWINDPNGFIQYKDKYHLFYQHNPYEAVWGPMHWGHAVSEDLIKWDYLPIALAPDKDFDRNGCFSGSAIEKDEKLYLMYTGHITTGPDEKEDYKQVQCLAYSEDGIDFIKHESNPVIDTKQVPKNSSSKDIRDPKTYKVGEFYYTFLGSNNNCGEGQVLMFKSKDLINWDFVNVTAKSHGDLGENWECPDLFSLQDKEVLIVSPQYFKDQNGELTNIYSCVYMVGNLDYKLGEFKYDRFSPVDYGFNFYAPQTTMDSKGRRIMVGWMTMWEKEYPTYSKSHNWAGAMTIPREVILKDTKLYFRPVEEIENYRVNEVVLKDLKISGDKKLDIIGDSYELEIVYDAKEADEFGLKLRVSDQEETVLSYRKKDRQFIFNIDKSGIGPKGERRAEVDLINNKLRLRIFVDKCSIEVFVNDGEKVMTSLIYPSEDAVGIKVFSKGESSIEILRKWDIK
ncbi:MULTISPECIES: glycoside hydrolase family 32 protein [unclassified Clostridium]|uniref:glycoside hydrolase family 32 protein n=1 Tax=unclassified Clostridium TaxID=2614128 RepID=UPI0002984D07|nr:MULTISPECIES: glycoside hydrolase family 32 protein [unclassified Clostridium]EKQ57923.1 MAG: sucrose-6-phosphate hydrolase [Clostridium sp. Maddingley MBC34-26]